MVTAADIGRAGERCAVAWLTAQGYRTEWNTSAPGSTDIQGWGAEHLLVQVKTAVLPSKPSAITQDETQNIKSRATRLGATAYVAQVQLDQNLRQVGEIHWSKLG
jgi:Holliday junction resolvase-like predicted endonuclease